EAETVIVTGTRVQGMTAADSAAPITVLGADALSHGTGSTDLRQQLGQAIPSFTAQQFGGDTANLTLSAALRGLSPNDTLVLINGHRRHYSGNLHVDSGDYTSGSAAPDISFIPSGAIDHVEVLLDGAAAQYGTDAIAGVVNIILKNKSSGGQAMATGGYYYNRGGIPTVNGLKSAGDKYDLSYNMGLPLFDKGFVNFTVEKQFGGFTQYGGADVRVAGLGPNGEGLDPTSGGAIPASVGMQIQGYPRINPINGNPEYQLTMGALNAGYDFSDNLQIYAFGTIGHKVGRSYENNRMPQKVTARPGSSQPCSAANPDGYAQGSSTADGATPSCTGPFALATAQGLSALPGAPGAGLNPATGTVISSGKAGSYTQPGELLPAEFGFRPLEALKEDDYQYNVGEKFNAFGWAFDLNVGYGKDIDNIYTLNSLNRSLFIDTHTSPTNFYDGRFTASQLTGTIDATHSYNVGLASPLTVAWGAEAREDTFRIGSGDPASYYKEGSNSFPGFPPAGTIDASRKNYATYLDFAVAPIEALQVDVAGRFEHYTDFGSTEIGKITARYDFNPQYAIRGTISTGFRAPTLAEEFYTAVNVSPNNASVQLPANSASAKVLGLENLRPEVSTSYSVGLVAHPLTDLSVTVDLYSIHIGDRITTSSEVYLIGGTPLAPALVSQAIALDHVTLDPTVIQAGVTAFANGLATQTQGIDLTANYPTDFGQYGLVNWTLAGNYNNTAVSSIVPVPAPLAAVGATFFTQETLFNFVHGVPATRLNLTADWSLDQFGVTLREQYWGPQHGYTSAAGCSNLPDCTFIRQAPVLLTDLEGRYNITDQLQLAIGANNLFNIHQNTVPWNPNAFGPGQGFPANGGNVLDTPNFSNFDPNGGYYYGRISFNF
ncbi:MAG TPA: TonB-dependent receptor, partial [Rhizomicrobium sp.]|nr:TonB-dependent receptor [Rhizomicrobium sp.]